MKFTTEGPPKDSQESCRLLSQVLTPQDTCLHAFPPLESYEAP